MKQRIFGAVLCLATLSALGAAWPGREADPIRRLPVQHGGRVKPFDSFARDTLWQITGEPQIGRRNPVETILSILAEPDPWQEEPLLQVPFIPLREALGMDPKAGRISYSDLLSARKLMKMLPAIVEKQSRSEKLTILENETMDLYSRFVAFSDLIGQKLHLVPPPVPQEEWLLIHPTPWAASWSALLEAWKNQDAAAFGQQVRELDRGLRQANPVQDADPWRMDLEVVYNRVAPFRIALALYLLAALLLAMGTSESWRRVGSVGLGLLVAGFLVHLGGIFLRVLLGSRPPVSNFYETMLWIPFVAVAVGLIFEGLSGGQYVVLSAAVLAVVMLALSQWVPLDSGLVPVVAVLRSNLWLTIHVLTIVASYGALGLAGVLAHLYGWRYWAVASGSGARRLGAPAAAGRDAPLEDLEISLYRVIQVGVILLAAGVMLGGVWANASWGRYWGWDPKETWALITLLWFLAALHGRFAGWLRGVGLALFTLGGLLLLLMTYYGVSFYLVGLHSYAGGNAKPFPPLLIAYAAAELAFMALIGRRSWVRKKAVS